MRNCNKFTGTSWLFYYYFLEAMDLLDAIITIVPIIVTMTITIIL